MCRLLRHYKTFKFPKTCFIFTRMFYPLSKLRIFPGNPNSWPVYQIVILNINAFLIWWVLYKVSWFFFDIILSILKSLVSSSLLRFSENTKLPSIRATNPTYKRTLTNTHNIIWVKGRIWSCGFLRTSHLRMMGYFRLGKC